MTTGGCRSKRASGPGHIAAAWSGSIVVRERALTFYRPVVPFCRELRDQCESFIPIARLLNESSQQDLSGNPFTVANVADLLERSRQGRLESTNPNPALRAILAGEEETGSTMDPDPDDDFLATMLEFWAANSDDDPDHEIAAGRGEPIPRFTDPDKAHPVAANTRFDPITASTYVALVGASEWGSTTNPDQTSASVRPQSWHVGPT